MKGDLITQQGWRDNNAGFRKRLKIINILVTLLLMGLFIWTGFGN